MTDNMGRTVVACMLAALVLAGCCNIIPTPNPAPAACSDAACFIAAANNCEDMNVTLSGNVATFAYTSSQNCVFTKTLVSVDSNETLEMKDFLTGKSMTCAYQKGSFNPGLVTSLVDGMENCTGGLKDALGELLVFT
ncbi:MAG: hypothetical protein PHV13_05230 [Candidatus ainarchaeum sp.]|nr:hypothetical protein [Candidatus ainarchaeum sp.]